MKEQEQRIALVHGYGIDHAKEKPNRRGRLQVLAAQELLRHGEIDSIAMTGGAVNLGETPLAEAMVQQLHRNNPHLDEQVLYVNPVARNTEQEIQAFQEILREHPNTRGVFLANETHLPRIRRQAKRVFGNKVEQMSMLSTEAVLSTRQYIQTQRYQTLIAELRASSDELAFQRRERVVNLIDSIPVLGPLALNAITRIPAKDRLLKAITKRFA